MFKPNKLLLFLSLFLIFLLAFPSLVFSQEESITITTYYPSPYGSYNSLQTDKLGVGDNNSDGSLTSADVPTTAGDVWIKGNVGIGTTEPGSKLHINVGADINDDITLRAINYSDAEEHTIKWISGAAKVARIGTVYNSITSSIDFFIGDLYSYGVQSSKLFYIQGNGNVGIGTTGPEGKLHVMTASAGTVTADSGADILVLEDNTDSGLSILTPDANTGRIYFGSPSDNIGATIKYNFNNDEMLIGTDNAGAKLTLVTGAGATAMTLLSTGNVGIGTTSPGAKLDVSGAMRATGVCNSSGSRCDHVGIENLSSWTCRDVSCNAKCASLGRSCVQTRYFNTPSSIILENCSSVYARDCNYPFLCLCD